MDQATGAIGSLLPKLSLLLKEYKLQKSVKEDIEFLLRELSSMHAVLRKVADVPRDKLDEQVKIWASQARELSYEFEGVVDSFLLRVDGRGSPISPDCRFESLMKRTANLFKKADKDGPQIADAIKGIKQQVQELASMRDRHRFKVGNVDSVPTATQTIARRSVAIYKDQSEIVGIEYPRDELIKMLTDGDDDVSKQLKIHSIFGSGGLGKTTLAKAVYDSIQMQFNCSAFVCIGQNPDIKKVLNNVLFCMQSHMEMAMEMDEQELIVKLRELLEDKRYFIVIDDIWDRRVWEIIRLAFINNKCGSRIIMTTRNSEVAALADDVYKLKPLSHDNSKELFYTRLYGRKGNCPSDQPSELPDRILQKCGGLPLAIITIASLLAGKPEEYWYDLSNSIGFGYDDTYIESTIKLLLFSYYDLPSYLRTCLLHLSMFSEDFTIPKDTLIWKWVAEGFIHEVQGTGLFELGEVYFNKLIDSSMILPIEIPYCGIVCGCRVHDLVLDIICSLSNEENFVTVLDGNGEHRSSQSNVRRLAVKNRVVEHDDLLVDSPMPQVRSFNATMCHFNKMPSLSSFQDLRVLAIEHCTFMEGSSHHLKHIGGLLQLRYLGIDNTPVDEIPEEIGELRFLQTLHLRNTKIEELPQSVRQLRQLKFLRADVGSTRTEEWIGHLTSLEKLSLSFVSLNIVKELGKLKELREIEIYIQGFDESSNEALVDSLSNLPKVKVLQLFGAGWCSEEINWEGYVPPPELCDLHLSIESLRLPAWITSLRLPNLSQLYISVKSVKEEEVDLLGGCPQLIALTLFTREDVVFPDVVGGGAFPKLRYFHISAVPRFLPGAMPSLESVRFDIRVRALKDASCFDGFDFLEDSLGRNLPSLQDVRVEIYCRGAESTDVMTAKAALRHAVDLHPNHPSLLLRKFGEGEMTALSSDQDLQECSTSTQNAS